MKETQAAVPVEFNFVGEAPDEPVQQVVIRFAAPDEEPGSAMRKMLDEMGLRERACRAYRKAGGTDEPSNVSGIEEDKGRNYLVLRNCNGILAVFRITTKGALHRLKRWPKALSHE
jgi:hypothetical protein